MTTQAIPKKGQYNWYGALMGFAFAGLVLCLVATLIVLTPKGLNEGLNPKEFALFLKWALGGMALFAIMVFANRRRW